jgi:hypothetical protein
MHTVSLRASRWLDAAAGAVFEGFERPELLARWWGPAGFSNTFERFEFRPGGRWVFVMHGPDGRDYPNECAFRVVEPGLVELEHVVAPLFTLRVAFEAEAAGRGSPGRRPSPVT